MATYMARCLGRFVSCSEGGGEAGWYHTVRTSPGRDGFGRNGLGIIYRDGWEGRWDLLGMDGQRRDEDGLGLGYVVEVMKNKSLRLCPCPLHLEQKSAYCLSSRYLLPTPAVIPSAAQQNSSSSQSSPSSKAGVYHGARDRATATMPPTSTIRRASRPRELLFLLSSLFHRQQPSSVDHPAQSRHLTQPLLSTIR